MNDSKISVRYSRALFQSALEKKMLERVFEDMDYVRQVCAVAEVRELLHSPVIVPSKKTKILHAVFGKELCSLTYSLIDMVITNGRESYLPAIARVFMSNTMKYNGITETVLTTAVKVNDKTKKQISGLVSSAFKTKVELKEVIDKDIIGGFILRIDDRLIDASVRNKLRKIGKELKSTTLTS
ncbi:MAG: ATP synthase F1 subunit delta [Bacteroidetes bacterium RBG_13_43_22]|nr:MAG: ATP synthase F1 subunit delta [Bacteroidetes bacterium RBG_13_43_22]